MPDNETLEIFRATGALLTGHFQLTSGLHNHQYLQPALALQDPTNAGKLGRLLAAHFSDKEIALVLAMDPGGMIVGIEVARALGARCRFAERQSEASILSLGFEIRPGERILIVEEMATIGGPTVDLIDAIIRAGADVVGIGSLVNQGRGASDLGVPRISLLTII